MRTSASAPLLHERDIVRLTLSSLIKRHSLQSLLTVLALDPVTLRKRGGPAKVWNEDGDGDILIEQLDYHQILRDTDSARSQAAKDELWRLHLVRSVRRLDSSLSEAEQARLLEIAEDPHAIGELAADAIRSTCTPDGSPLVTTQASTVLATYRHLRGIVSVMAPDRTGQAMQNVAASTAELDPRVVVELMKTEPEQEGSAEIVRDIAESFDDAQVTQLLATTLALDGKATERLAEVFDSIAMSSTKTSSDASCSWSASIHRARSCASRIRRSPSCSRSTRQTPTAPKCAYCSIPTDRPLARRSSAISGHTCRTMPPTSRSTRRSNPPNTASTR